MAEPSTNGVPGSRYSPEAWAEFREIVGNAMLGRREFFNALTDPRRDLEDSCGYPRLDREVSIELYRQLYDRDAIAARVVEVLPLESWQVSPMVYEDADNENVTPFEEAWDRIGSSLGGGSGITWFDQEKGSPLYEYLVRVDVRSGIGHFGLLLLGIDDGLPLHEPAEGVIVTGRKVERVEDDDEEDDEENDDEVDDDGTDDDVEEDDAEEAGDDEVSEDDEEEGKGDNVPVPGAPGRGKRGSGKDRPVKRRPPVANHGVTFRVTNAYGRPMPDSPMSPGEEQTLRNLPMLTANEERVIGVWGRQRSDVLRNAKFPSGKEPTDRARDASGRDVDDVLAGPDRSMEEPPTKTPPPNGKKPRKKKGAKGFGKNGKPESSDDGKDDEAGGRSPEMDLSGTDAQYYGVQFGPTEEAAEEPASEERKLLFMRVFDESLVQVVRYEWNVKNPRFGMPVMYRITLNDPRESHTGIGLPNATVFVHWSRVIHVADNLGCSEFMGRPRMQQVLNNVLGLRKLYCGSPEMFWRGAFPGLALSTHPQLGGDVQVDRTGMKDTMENYFNDLQRYLLLTGMSAQTLSPTVADPSPHIAQQLEAICIKLGIPVRIFKGSERGELASAQDDGAWNDRLRHRQQFFITPRIVVPFVDRLISLGVLPEPESYRVSWPDLESLNEKDKATIAQTMVTAMGAYVSGGLEALMAPIDFLTRVMGFDEEEADQIIETAAVAAEEKAAMEAEAAAAQQPQIGPDGQPIEPQPDAEGNPIEPQLDEEGNPIEPELGPDGQPIAPEPQLDEDGNPVEPVEGEPELDEDGNPVEPEQMVEGGEEVPVAPAPVAGKKKPVPPQFRK